MFSASSSVRFSDAPTSARSSWGSISSGMDLEKVSDARSSTQGSSQSKIVGNGWLSAHPIRSATLRQTCCSEKVFCYEKKGSIFKAKFPGVREGTSPAKRKTLNVAVWTLKSGALIFSCASLTTNKYRESDAIESDSLTVWLVFSFLSTPKTTKK